MKLLSRFPCQDGVKVGNFTFSSVWEGRSVQSFWTRVLPLVCSLDLLFGHNLVSVAVVVFLHSLITHYLRTLQSNLTEITNSRNEAVCFIVCSLDCSDIWWSYMHKINQSFKPIIYKKKIKPKYCYLMGYCLKGRCLLKFMFYGKQGYCVIFVRQSTTNITVVLVFAS